MAKSIKNRSIFLQIVVVDVFQVHLHKLDDENFEIKQIVIWLIVLHVGNHFSPRFLKIDKIKLF